LGKKKNKGIRFNKGKRKNKKKKEKIIIPRRLGIERGDTWRRDGRWIPG